jgi:hypothetical protein
MIKDSSGILHASDQARMNGSRYIAEQIKAENKQMIQNKASHMQSQHSINIMHEK